MRKAGLIRNNRRRTVSAVKTGREKWENTCENDMGTKRERITRNKGKRGTNTIRTPVIHDLRSTLGSKVTRQDGRQESEGQHNNQRHCDSQAGERKSDWTTN